MTEHVLFYDGDFIELQGEQESKIYDLNEEFSRLLQETIREIKSNVAEYMKVMDDEVLYRFKSTDESLIRQLTEGLKPYHNYREGMIDMHLEELEDNINQRIKKIIDVCIKDIKVIIDDLFKYERDQFVAVIDIAREHNIKVFYVDRETMEAYIHKAYIRKVNEHKRKQKQREIKQK